MSQNTLETVSISTEEISALVAPELGGRLIELTDLRRDRQWLWRNHRVPLSPPPPGASYDDVWVGGFEELFPNDAPTELGDWELPDHGETWSQWWDVRHRSKDRLELGITTGQTGIDLVKTITMTGDLLEIEHRVSNGGDRDLPYLFKLHPAFAVDEACTIDLPGGLVEKVDPSVGNLLPASPERVAWPTAADLDTCRPASSGSNEFVYVHDLPEGRCGITDANAGCSIELRYDLADFPYCWIFMTYGGWREHNVVVLEPCTNYPKDLPTAIASGTSALLRAGDERSFKVTVALGVVDG